MTRNQWDRKQGERSKNRKEDGKKSSSSEKKHTLANEVVKQVRRKMKTCMCNGRQCHARCSSPQIPTHGSHASNCTILPFRVAGSDAVQSWPTRSTLQALEIKSKPMQQIASKRGCRPLDGVLPILKSKLKQATDAVFTSSEMWHVPNAQVHPHLHLVDAQPKRARTFHKG